MRVPAFDGLRGVAILAVILLHAAPATFPLGFLGVDAFFVLSGYLITAGLLREWEAARAIDLRAFFARRVRRLAPALVVLLALVGGLELANESARLTCARVGAVAGYAANWMRAFELLDLGPFAHAWSLAIEEQFYLAWPILLLAALRARVSREALAVGALLGVVLVVALRWRLLAEGATLERLYHGTDTRGDALLAGSAAALAPWSRPWLRRLGLVAASSALLAARERWHDPRFYATWGWAAFAVLVALIVLELAAGSPLARVLEVPILRRLGEVSYGLYLWHGVAFHYLPPDRFRPAFTCALSLAAALVSYGLLERRFLRRAPRLQDAPDAREAAQAGAGPADRS